MTHRCRIGASMAALGSAALLTISLIGPTFAEALREAMLALIDGDGFKDDAGRTVFSYAHPLFWAPYSIIGDGG